MKGIKEKIFEISSIGITDFLSTGIAAIFWLYIASSIGPENYGELIFLISIASVISGIALFGSNNTILVLASKKIDIQSTIYLITIITNAIGAIIAFILFLDVGVSLIVIAYAIFPLVTHDLLARKLYPSYSKYIITQKILLVTCGIGLYYVIGESGILIGIGISHIHFVYHIVKTFKNSKINFGIIKEKGRFIFNNFLLSISGTFSGSFDKLIIAPLLGFSVLGNYSLGLQFFAILDLLPSICIKYLITQDVAKIPNKLLKKIIVLASVGIAILGSTVGPIVMSHLFPKFIEAEQVIQIICWAVIPSTIQATYHFPKFFANEKNGIVVVITLITIGIQITSILVLGSIYGTIGVAIAFLLSNICSTITSSVAEKFFLKINESS
jgi:O-antigen/teichoic acid export membrane protein